MPTKNKAFLSVKPELQTLVWTIMLELEKKGWQPQVAEGLRTIEEQKEKVRLGYSQTLNSRHLTGRAVDVIDKRYGWNIPLHHPFWLDYGHLVLATNQLQWGGIWLHPERLKIMEEAVKNQSGKQLTWFADTAHCELLVSL